MNAASEFPEVHIGVDWQSHYLVSIGCALFNKSGGKIPTTQPAGLKAEAVAFATRMFAEGVPTIWLMMMLRADKHFLSASRKVSPYILQKSRLALTPTPDDWVGNKHTLSCFSNPLLLPLLQKWKTTKLIMTGSETGKCLAATAADALTLGFQVYIHVGLATDHALAGAPIEEFKAKNRALLDHYFESFGIDTTNLRMIDSVSLEKEKPTSPVRAMSVLNPGKGYG